MTKKLHSRKLHSTADEQLREKILTQLAWEPAIRAEDIAVSVRDGAVTLAGSVDNWYEKCAATAAAGSVPGVRAIANELAMPTTARSDSQIAHEIAELFRADGTIPKDRLNAVVTDGVVTLEGMADWHYERAHACDCVAKLPGVRAVKNRIAVRSVPATDTAKIEIAEALKRSVRVNAKDIEVISDGHTVTLSGSVRSPKEREAAERAAWAATGVTQVIDRLAIVP